MLFGYGLLVVAQLALLVYCVLNVLTTPTDQVRTLPKLLWLALVVLFPLVGGVAWLLAGRPKGTAGSLRGRVTPRPVTPPRPPDDDEDFLRELRRRAEEQRRRAQGEEPPAA